MQKTSELWKTLWRNPLHEEEIKLNIAGTEYIHADIVDESLNISGGMFSELDIGNCAARQIDVEVYPKGIIPRQAEIKVYRRLVHGTQVSEWLQNGVFYISTRQQNKITGTLSIHGFDAMLKASAVWLTHDYDFDNWPKTESEAVDDITLRMSVKLDPRTRLNNQFMVEYPVDENGDMTMMDILEGIAVANCGNWIMTDAGELLLRRLGEEPSETNYLVEEYGSAITFGGVKILV